MAKKHKDKKENATKPKKVVESLVTDAENALANFEMQNDDVGFVEDVFASQVIRASDLADSVEAEEKPSKSKKKGKKAKVADTDIETASESDANPEDIAMAALSITDVTDAGNADEAVGHEATALAAALADFDAEDLEASASDDSVIEEEGSENELEGFMPEDGLNADSEVEGSELAAFDSVEIENVEELTVEKIASVVESLLFASDKPQSVAMLKAAFIGSKVRSADIRAAIKHLDLQFANPERGVEIHEISGGYQLRTKPDNAQFMQKTIKARPFRLSGPALEVLAIVAYKQPAPKVVVDEIRGVESGHLMRALLERGLIAFGGKSELPGRPMLYETTKKFLEIFGLRHIEELPTLNEIDQLIPEGIGEPQEEKKTLGDVADELAQKHAGTTYSEGEEELHSISADLQGINLSTEFFEEEKRRARDKKDFEKAQEIRERQVMGEAITSREQKWLERFDAGTLYPPKEKFSADKLKPAEGEAPATVDSVVDAAIASESDAVEGAVETAAAEDAPATEAAPAQEPSSADATEASGEVEATEAEANAEAPIANEIAIEDVEIAPDMAATPIDEVSSDHERDVLADDLKVEEDVLKAASSDTAALAETEEHVVPAVIEASSEAAGIEGAELDPLERALASLKSDNQSESEV